MEILALVRADAAYAEQIWAYRSLFIRCHEIIPGSAGLERANNVDEWLFLQQLNEDERTVPNGLVPATTYLLIRCRDDRLLGMTQIRHRLNTNLSHYGGHIGYSIRPDERGRGYGCRLLQLALEKCRERKITRVLLTCDQDNVASARVIMRNGGIKTGEGLDDGIPFLRFEIRL